MNNTTANINLPVFNNICTKKYKKMMKNLIYNQNVRKCKQCD